MEKRIPLLIRRKACQLTWWEEERKVVKEEEEREQKKRGRFYLPISTKAKRGLELTSNFAILDS
jgi:hypothetical protein